MAGLNRQLPDDPPDEARAMMPIFMTVSPE